MSWLGGPLPGTGETIGLNPAPKFDPSYSDFYDQGGWTETIIGPDMSEEIYRGTVGDDRWSLDFLKDYTGSSDREPTNLDTAKSQYNLPTDRSRGSWYEQISPSVGVYGGSPSGGFLGGPLPAIAAGQGAFAGMNPGMQSLGFNDYAKMAAQGLGSALKSQALYAINPVLGAVDQFYPGGVQQGFKDVTKFAGDAFGGLAKGAGNIIKNIFCDERLKVDIAPLESTEVNDELAQMAFFVKGLRECS
jgi:hypothetical protein